MASKCINKRYTKDGPWGGDGGHTEWQVMLSNEGVNPYRITKIVVTYTLDWGCVVALTFTYDDYLNKKQHDVKVGGQTPGHDIEYIINKFGSVEFKGVYGKYNNCTVITALAFGDNPFTLGSGGTPFPPYPSSGGTIFPPYPLVGKIEGFFGKFGDYIDSIGVILSPKF
ncbi:horcolin-like [Rutidosis leptorrhynchoides]|uniref:horcolin-like n=1 Tax=Rutidosis leptorrhynchoides TaxID=125765 RepID=UPI003A9A0A54